MKDKMRSYAMEAMCKPASGDSKEAKASKKSMKKEALIMALKKKMSKK